MGLAQVSLWYVVPLCMVSGDSVLIKAVWGQVCAIVSLLTGKCVSPTTAMTGEVRNTSPHRPLVGAKVPTRDCCRSRSADASRQLAGSRKRC